MCKIQNLFYSMLISDLRTNVPGEPGLDYPIHNTVQVSLKDELQILKKSHLWFLQETSFTCDGKEFGGYYADPEMDCQAYHICLMVFAIDADILKFNEDFESLLRTRLKVWRSPCLKSEKLIVFWGDTNAAVPVVWGGNTAPAMPVVVAVEIVVVVIIVGG